MSYWTGEGAEKGLLEAPEPDAVGVICRGNCGYDIEEDDTGPLEPVYELIRGEVCINGLTSKRVTIK